MSSDKRKHEAREREQPRTGSVAPEDAELTTWLHSLWHRDEPPQRLEVWQLFGRNKQDRGKMIHHVDFKPNDRLDVERANKLANEILAVAQNDCDAVERKSSYEIAIIDLNRRASPLCRRLPSLHPQQKYLMKSDGTGGYTDEDDEEDGPLSGKSLGLAYIREGYDQVRWDKRRYDAVMGDLLALQKGIIDQQQGWIDRMMGERMNIFSQLQDSLDRQLDRDNAREWGMLKVMLARDGIRTARNLLPGLFGPDATGKTEPGLEPGNSNGENKLGTGAVENNHPFIDRFRGSPERALIDGFLSDCEEAGLSIALFGEWDEDEKDGHLVPVADKPGIFTPQQFAVLVGVRDGRLPPNAIDMIVPGSGDPKAITQEQVVRAQNLEGMTDAIGMSILELVGLRQRRREAANSSKTERTER